MNRRDVFITSSVTGRFTAFDWWGVWLDDLGNGQCVVRRPGPTGDETMQQHKDGSATWAVVTEPGALECCRESKGHLVWQAAGQTRLYV